MYVGLVVPDSAAAGDERRLGHCISEAQPE